MSYVEKIVMGMLLLILVYLLVANANGSNQVLGALGSNSVDLIKALQGRSF
jgi:hypothetical protein